MAKKGKKLLSLMARAAAAAGTYCYLKKKNEEIPTNMEDDDFDEFDVDVDDGPVSKSSNGKRSYVSLDFNTVEEKVKGAVSKVADAADKAKEVVGEKLGVAAGKVEEFFDDRKADFDEPETPAESGEPSEDDYEEPKSE
ncbi:MAG: hypothetical protein J5626_00700 [Lachnospiraceae bacterium]|nr:hypothetical protein [Lachnospiraceae bacterium]